MLILLALALILYFILGQIEGVNTIAQMHEVQMNECIEDVENIDIYDEYKKVKIKYAIKCLQHLRYMQQY